MFGFIKDALQKIYTSITKPIQKLLAGPIDDAAIKELESLLIQADTGTKTTGYLINQVKDAWIAGKLPTGKELRSLLDQELTSLLETKQYTPNGTLFLLVGINGSGKTTAAAKLATVLKNAGKKTLFIAADTFRAAAPEQLENWANTVGVTIFKGAPGQDPSSVIFAGIQKYKQEHFDALIIDTAGRLQTKINLMKELEKMKRVLNAQLPDQKITTLLTIDAMLGQNSFQQASVFHESTPIDGIILTKMDGTAKGGIVFAISHELHIPIAYISYGEKPEQFKRFNAQEYVHDLLS